MFKLLVENIARKILLYLCNFYAILFILLRNNNLAFLLVWHRLKLVENVLIFSTYLLIFSSPSSQYSLRDNTPRRGVIPVINRRGAVL
jgi:hypothetical protein